MSKLVKRLIVSGLTVLIVVAVYFFWIRDLFASDSPLVSGVAVFVILGLIVTLTSLSKSKGQREREARIKHWDLPDHRLK